MVLNWFENIISFIATPHGISRSLSEAKSYIKDDTGNLWNQ